MPDTLPPPPPAAKGRGTGWQLAHRFEADQRVADDDGWGSLEPAADEAAPPVATQVIESPPKKALTRNDSPDIGFDLAVNPYRGCEHGCIYCYARPTHSYLNLSPGLDFETRILARAGMAECLRLELAAPGYRPSPINIGSATDAYQPAERHWRVTRELLEVLVECGHPYTVVTKSAGLLRDLDLFERSARGRQVQIFISVTTLDPALARVLEPRAAAPRRRLDAIARLSAAGVPVAVNVAPIIPFLNEPEIERIIEAAAQAGARSVHYTVLRLPWEVAPLFKQWLAQHAPEKAARILARVRELHGLADAPEETVYRSVFGDRMKGRGVWAQLIRQRVRQAGARHGLGDRCEPLDVSAFRPPARRAPGRPGEEAQSSLF